MSGESPAPTADTSTNGRRLAARPSPLADAYTAEDDCILVDIEHVDVVLRYLDEWRGEPRPEDADETLGLAKVRFDSAAVAKELRAKLDGGPEPWLSDAAARAGADRPDHSPLNLTLAALKTRSSAEGASVLVGKNRAADLVRVTQGIQFGSKGQLDMVRGFYPEGRAWQYPGGRAEVTVGMVDAQPLDHPWTTPSLAPECPPSRAALDLRAGRTYHGTFVAGTILRRAGQVRIRVEPVQFSAGGAQSFDVARGMVALADAGVPIVNVSLCCLTEDDEPPLVFTRALERIAGRSIVVAAAGNHAKDGRSNPFHCPKAWPAALEEVVAVGALNRRGALASYSPAMDWVDVFALGSKVVSSLFVDWRGRARYGRASGTSFAAADVSGQLANLILSGREPRDAKDTLLGLAPTHTLYPPTTGQRAVPTLPPLPGWPR